MIDIRAVFIFVMTGVLSTVASAETCGIDDLSATGRSDYEALITYIDEDPCNAPDETVDGALARAQYRCDQIAILSVARAVYVCKEKWNNAGTAVADILELDSTANEDLVRSRVNEAALYFLRAGNDAGLAALEMEFGSHTLQESLAKESSNSKECLQVDPTGSQKKITVLSRCASDVVFGWQDVEGMCATVQPDGSLGCAATIASGETLNIQLLGELRAWTACQEGFGLLIESGGCWRPDQEESERYFQTYFAGMMQRGLQSASYEEFSWCGREYWKTVRQCMMGDGNVSGNNACSIAPVEFAQLACPATADVLENSVSLSFDRFRSEFFSEPTDCLKAIHAVDDNGNHAVSDYINTCKFPINVAIWDRYACRTTGEFGYGCLVALPSDYNATTGKWGRKVALDFGMSKTVYDGKLRLFAYDTPEGPHRYSSCRAEEFPYRLTNGADDDWLCVQKSPERDFPLYVKNARQTVESIKRRHQANEQAAIANYRYCSAMSDQCLSNDRNSSAKCTAENERCRRERGLRSLYSDRQLAEFESAPQSLPSFDWSATAKQVFESYNRAPVVPALSNSSNSTNFDARKECETRTSHLAAQLNETAPGSATGVRESARQSMNLASISQQVAQICKPLFPAGSADRLAFEQQEREAQRAYQQAKAAFEAASSE